MSLSFFARIFTTLILAVIFVSPSLAEPPNLGLLKRELKAYHDSGLYEKELARVVAKAQYYVLQQAARNEKRGNPKKLALVLDIDETSISNYNKLLEYHFNGDDHKIIRAIINAQAPAIKPILSLYTLARQHGIAVFFVTGRPMSLLKTTREILLHAGYHDWTGLYLRPDSYQQPSIMPFKAKARQSITNQGYTIIAAIGDQFSDIQGGYTQKEFKLPNPYYYLP